MSPKKSGNYSGRSERSNISSQWTKRKRKLVCSRRFWNMEHIVPVTWDVLTIHMYLCLHNSVTLFTDISILFSTTVIIQFPLWITKASSNLTVAVIILFFSSFIRCIPKSFAKLIYDDNFLTKLRIRRVFADFVKTFQQHTVAKGRLGSHEIMYKYISTLEHLAPRFGIEMFPVSHMEQRKDGVVSSSYSDTNHAQGVSKASYIAPATHEIMVSGTKGIQWRDAPGPKVRQQMSSLSRPHSVTCCYSASEDIFFFLSLHLGPGQLLPQEWPSKLH